MHDGEGKMYFLLGIPCDSKIGLNSRNSGIGRDSREFLAIHSRLNSRNSQPELGADGID